MNTSSRLAAAVAVLAPGLAAAAPTDIVISEVFYLGATDADEWIELRNTGTQTINVSNWIFDARTNPWGLWLMTILEGDDLVLEPGETVTLQSDPHLSLSPASDLGLYSTTLVWDPNVMVDFVQWGTDMNVGRADVAVLKGIWNETSPGQYDFVPTAGAGESLSYLGRNSGGGLLTLSSDFVNGMPSQGTPVEPTSWGRIKNLYRTE